MGQARVHGALDRFAPRLAASIAQLRRDVRMVVGGWRGERHPLVPRSTRRRARHLVARPAPSPPDGAAHLDAGPDARAGAPQPVTVHIGGRAHTIQAAPGETILEAGLAAGLPMKFSCTVGGCGTCRVKLRAGRVDVEEPSCLSDAERQAGYVLACVSRPAEPVEVEAATEEVATEEVA